jgi:hypothetical protein
MKKMTLEEKIGQMTQLTIDVLGVPGSAYQGEFQLSEAMMDTVIGMYKVGSILNTPAIDLGRDARWSRMWENYGEDAYVNAEMGREAVLGMQGDDPNHIGSPYVCNVRNKKLNSESAC